MKSYKDIIIIAHCKVLKYLDSNIYNILRCSYKRQSISSNG